MSKPLLLAVLLLAATSVTVPAFAFSEEPAPTNPNGTAKFADPDDLADGMADGMSGGSGASTSSYLHMFSSDGATLGVVTSRGTLQRPYDPNDPTTH